MMKLYFVTAGPRKHLGNPEAPKTGWVRSLSAAYRFRSVTRARRIAARSRKHGVKVNVGRFVAA